MKYLAVAALVVLSGCSILDRDQRLDTQNQVSQNQASRINLATGYVLLAQVRMMAADAVKTKLITPDKGREFLDLTDTARKTLDAARDHHFAGSPDAALKGMEIVDLIMNQVRNEIESRIRQKALKGDSK